MHTNKLLYFVIALAIVAAAIPLTSLAMAGDNQDPRIIPNQALPHGSSYDQWTVEWSKWLVLGSSAEAPFLDTTGDKCAFGQSGKVFFIGGNTNATLDCVIPHGTMIFTPIDWGVWWNPEDSWCTEDPGVCEMGGTAIIDQVDIVDAEIDGVPVANPMQYRASSGAFVLDIAPGSWLAEFGYPPGPRYPTVAEGHWLMLAPFSSGEHTIHLVWGSSAWGGVVADTTYHITVAGSGRPASP